MLPTVHLLPDAAPEGIIINLADMRLYYFAEPGGPMQSFPIGIGREGLLTPLGSTKVVRKNKDPTWRPTPRMRAENPELPEAVPAGPDNPLGNRAMYLGWPQYLIHGTNKPLGIGRRTSSGCVRMYPEDVEYLFDRIAVGTKVTVVDQPIKLSWIDDALYIEALRPRRRATRSRPRASSTRSSTAAWSTRCSRWPATRRPRSTGAGSARRPSSGAAIRSGSPARAPPADHGTRRRRSSHEPW